ncbi:hypothetical protein [Emticicia agri]|uniref:Uncharacterized protein n=1 Tax=Emticicia agri TaxID=2492393 RepID=A0A4Q5LVZ2_9BACT|nr:hypothetical protein [Emticicia agri]RYU93888.1 hypothetical protein EWM59_19810 [Emticicia agri]
MGRYLLLFFVVMLTSCGQLKEKAQTVHAADSTALGQWRPPNESVVDVTIYKKEGKVFLHENFNDQSILNEEMVVESTENVIKLKYKEVIAEEYMMIDKEGNLRWYTGEGREFAKSKPKQ